MNALVDRAAPMGNKAIQSFPFGDDSNAQLFVPTRNRLTETSAWSFLFG
jgi:hypothetical protein